MAQNMFRDMPCFILAGGKHNQHRDFQDMDGVTRLERGYRRYAAVFEKVKLVLKRDQARERYLNYPHVCDDDPDYGELVGLHTALNQPGCEAVFIGSSEIIDFPLELVVNLVKNYRGEPYLAYFDQDASEHPRQPLFGIYHRSLAPRIAEALSQGRRSMEVLPEGEGRMIPLPEGVPGEQIGIR